MKRILSIDGGGIRGIIPALALQTLEEETGKAALNMFDMFVGTSTGGILALALARGKSPAQIVDLFEKRGAEIFSKPWYWLGLTGPKYSADGIEKVLREEIGENLLSTAMKPVAVTCGSLLDRRAMVIRSWMPEAQDTTMWAAARATSAAPTFFPSFGHRKLIDGGVWANNPAYRAYMLASKFFPGEPFQMLSLGTGQKAGGITPKGEGIIGHAGHLITELMDFENGVATRDCEEEMGERFVRSQVRFLDGKWAMDDASTEYIARLKDAAEAMQNDMRTLVRTRWWS